jgi:acid phosphatase family membrane protein YuiD
MRACSFIFVLNSFPVVVQVMYDASGVRLQAGRQAEVCTSTLLSYHTILSLLTSAASIRDLTDSLTTSCYVGGFVPYINVLIVVHSALNV